MYIAKSNSASSSPMWMIPLVTRVCILQKVWTVRPKWWPRWTKGSCIDLNTDQIVYGSTNEILTVSFVVQVPRHLDWHISEHLVNQKGSWNRHNAERCLSWWTERHDCHEDVKLMNHRRKESYLYLGQGLDALSGKVTKKTLFSKICEL